MQLYFIFLCFLISASFLILLNTVRLLKRQNRNARQIYRGRHKKNNHNLGQNKVNVTVSEELEEGFPNLDAR